MACDRTQYRLSEAAPVGRVAWVGAWFRARRSANFGEAEMTPDASFAYFEEDTHSLWIPVLSVDVRDASGDVPA